MSDWTDPSWMDQPPNIPDPPGGVGPAEENNPDKRDLRKEAAIFIAENPAVYELFMKFAREMLEVYEHFGINLLTERVRWEVKRFWKKDERGFKINNNHSPYISRKLVEDEPRLEPLLRFRRTRY